MKNNTYPFDGWDYLELAIAWNLYIPDDDNTNTYVPADNKVIKWFLEGVLRNYSFGEKRFVIRKVAKDLRIFLSKLGSYESYEKKVWLAMAEMESDVMLIVMVKEIIPLLWY